MSVAKSPVNIVTFANAMIFDEQGTELKLGTLWRERTIIFVFLRHFGCVSCRGHALDVWRQRESYEKTGAKIVFIGNGNPHFIEHFKNDLGMEGAPIYTDPSLISFYAAGFKRGFLVALGPHAIVNGIKMLIKGARQGATAGDLWQLGGVIAVKPDGRVAYHYISEVMGDFPPTKDLDEFSTE